MKVSELSKRLSDLESQRMKPTNPFSDCRSIFPKSSSRPIFKSQNSKVKTISSPIFYGKTGTYTKLSKDMTSSAKCNGTDSAKSVKPNTPKGQKGLKKQVYVPVLPKLVLIFEKTPSKEKDFLRENSKH